MYWLTTIFYVLLETYTSGYLIGFPMFRTANLYSQIRESSPDTTAEQPSPIGQTNGFGKPKLSIAPVEKDVGTVTYDSQAKRGVPEYSIFLRAQNTTDTEWVPVGSMTISRETSVAKAVFEVEAELLAGTFKLYPKLKLFYDQQSMAEPTTEVFQYGYCLKAFPDEEIRVIEKEETKKNSNFFANW